MTDHHVRPGFCLDMAKRFLDQLAKIPENELSEDRCCMICRQDYGTDSLDVAVRLPCNHHVGLE